MAWSDAARAAALEARRAHANAKAKYSRDAWHTTYSGDRELKFASVRKNLAKQLMAVRAGKPAMGLAGHKFSPASVHEYSARSTFLRNVARAYDRREGLGRYAKKGK